MLLPYILFRGTIVTLKSALDELLAAHDEFDAASFYPKKP